MFTRNRTHPLLHIPGHIPPGDGHIPGHIPLGDGHIPGHIPLGDGHIFPETRLLEITDKFLYIYY